MTQQAISYDYPVQPSAPAISQNVTVPLSWGFTSNSDKIQPSMQDAVYSGLFGNWSNGLPSNSSSGGYPWQTYQSLAVCARCSKPKQDNPCQQKDMCFLSINTTSPHKFPKNHDYEIINTSYTTEDPDGPILQAGQCALFWCLRTYEVRSDDISTLTEIQPPLYDNSCTQRDGRELHTMMPANTSNETFWVDAESNNQISEWMSRLLKGSERCSPPTRVQGRGNEDRRHNHQSDYEGDSCRDSNPILSSLSGSIEQKFNSIAAAMTDQIQRTPNPNEPNTFIGRAQAVRTFRTTFETHPIFAFQWAWLTLPIGLIVLAFIVLIGTMVRTSEKKTALWKSCTLALFFHGRGAQQGVYSARGERMDHIAGMEDVAGQIKVRFEDTGRYWRLAEERRTTV